MNIEELKKEFNKRLDEQLKEELKYEKQEELKQERDRRMKKITRNELNEILEEHKKWLSGDGGKCAYLSKTNLSSVHLIYADLRNADLRYTDLRHADLRYTDLRHANLISADLRDADLRYADLSNADLRRADLRYCNTEFIKGQNIISVQVNTSRENNKISYWKDLEVWTTDCFQGTLDEWKERVKETHKDNKFLYDRYQRAIEYILNESEVEE